MKKVFSRLLVLAFAAGSLVSFSSCTSNNTGDGTSVYSGPSTANTPNYTEQLRSEFRQNW